MTVYKHISGVEGTFHKRYRPTGLSCDYIMVDTPDGRRFYAPETEWETLKQPQGAGRMRWPLKKKSKKEKIVERSNVIQFDGMGYPLRLCIMSDGTQMWLDTNERDGDVILRWEELEE